MKCVHKTKSAINLQKRRTTIFSLPDINRMNSEAYQNKKKLERACHTGTLDRKKLVCEWSDHDDPSRCEGELRHYLWYDIFSNDPKGILTLCEHHDGYYGSPSEGFFECDSCGRVHTENYTWERYEAITEDGRSLCLPCYAEETLVEDSNWIPLTDEAINAVTETAVRKAKHLIGVRMPCPAGIEFKNNVEYDSYSGASISGGGAEELKSTLRNLKAEGFARAILILDAAYQFAVSVGVYVSKGGKFDVQPTEAKKVVNS